MYRFTAQGRIGRIDELKKGGLRISVAAERLVDGPDGQWTKTEWLSCISFDAELNTKLQTELEVGMSVKFEGRVEPRKRMLGDVKIYDQSFVVLRFERLSKPKSNGKGKTDATDQPSA
jgi:hypothetical protein